MTESKKPPKAPSKRPDSAVFEGFRPSLGPGPAGPLPPPWRSGASMPPLKVPGKNAPAETEPAGAPASEAAVPVPAPPTEPPPPASLQPPPLSLSPARPTLAPATSRSPPARRGSRRWLALVAVALVAAALVVVRLRYGERALPAPASPAHVGTFSTTLDIRQFQRGNIHTHTTRSDGTQSPRDVATWYRDHGYQFLAITDHNVLVDPGELEGLEGPGFTLVPGEEISSTAGPAPVHVQALCIDHLIEGGAFDTPAQALRSMVAAVRDQGGVPVVNHPNFSWALGIADLATLTGPYTLEIWSGHPAVHSLGDGKRPSHETMWDELLTRGRHVTAVAVDDVHTLVPLDGGTNALPGLGWIQTFGEPGRAPICDALRSGRFYASSGVTFRRILVEAGRVTVWVDDAADAVVFLGSAAQVLATVTGDALVRDADGLAATYALHGGETYVRVHATAPGGGAAWTQAFTTNP